MSDGFIRAFWRRVEPYKNDHEPELPEEIPVEIKCAFETASILLRKPPVLWQHRFKEMNESCVNYGEFSDWESCDERKAKEIQQYIDAGYSYELRALAVVDA